MLVAVFLAAFGGTHYFLYASVVAAFDLGRSQGLWALRALFACGAVSFPVLRMLARRNIARPTVLIDWIVVTWLALVIYGFLAALVIRGVAALCRATGLWPRLLPPLEHAPGPVAASVAAAVVVGLVAFGFVRARSLPRTTTIQVRLANLPPDLDGFTLVHLSDLHLGAFAPRGRLRRIVDRVNALSPDLVAITGDLVDERAAQLEPWVQQLAELRPRYGVLAVPGNHDFFAGVEEVTRRAATAHIRFLRNERVIVAGKLLVYGIDDPMGARLGFEAANVDQVVGADARERPSILLCHQPTGYARLAALGVGLVLSGHTHGGQMWPLRRLSRLLHPYDVGHHRVGASHFYVSRGTGTFGPPMRLGVPSEIVQIHLVSAPSCV
ncbi:MAG TPA: metallophosphoesterase [Polyangiaceae bacterium]